MCVECGFRTHATHLLRAVADRVLTVDSGCRGRDPAALQGTRHWVCRLQPARLGFLTGNVVDIAALCVGDARRNMPRFQADNLRRNLELVEELKKLAAVEKCTPTQLAIAWVLSRAPYIAPIPGTSHRPRLEENAAAASLKISADTEAALLKVFAPGAASGLRYPENHLVRLGI